MQKLSSTVTNLVLHSKKSKEEFFTSFTNYYIQSFIHTCVGCNIFEKGRISPRGKMSVLFFHMQKKLIRKFSHAIKLIIVREKRTKNALNLIALQNFQIDIIMLPSLSAFPHFNIHTVHIKKKENEHFFPDMSSWLKLFFFCFVI